MAILLRLLFGFNVNFWLACAAGAGSRMATWYFGPEFVAPDWWAAEMVIAAAVTLALLGIMQAARAQI